MCCAKCIFISFIIVLFSSRNTTSTNVTDDALDMESCWFYPAQNETLVDVVVGSTFTRLDCYRASLIGFLMVLGPFAFFNVQKTKYIQMCSIVFRWLAFTVMISIAVRRLLVDGVAGHPPIANLQGIPALFGTCVYSFMCHHSLPSLVVPIRDKNGLFSMLSADYALIGSFYLLLALTGSFAFSTLDDLYTLNFIPTVKQSGILIIFIEYFLALFPVFTLSASFPIIAITLRNNLQALFLDTTSLPDYNFVLRRLTFPLLAILPPIAVTYFTDSLTSLVSFTGSYAGTGIQYIIPVVLVWQARKICSQTLGQGIINEYRSPFQSVAWLIVILVWACTCIILVTLNFFLVSLPSDKVDLYLPEGDF